MRFSLCRRGIKDECERDLSPPRPDLCAWIICVWVVCPLTASIAVTSDHSPSNRLKAELTELVNKHRHPQHAHTEPENFKETMKSSPPHHSIPFHQLSLFTIYTDYWRHLPLLRGMCGIMANKVSSMASHLRGLFQLFGNMRCWSVFYILIMQKFEQKLLLCLQFYKWRRDGR